MSRIQNILEKAEREGTVHRVRAVAGTDSHRRGSAHRDGASAGHRPADARSGVPAPAPAGAEGHRLPARPAPCRGWRRSRRRRTVSCAADANLPFRQRRAGQRAARHQPGPRRGQDAHRRQPGPHDGAGISAGDLPGRRQFPVSAAPPDVRLSSRRPALSDVLAGAASFEEALVTLDDYPTRCCRPAQRRRIRPNCSARRRCDGRWTRCAPVRCDPHRRRRRRRRSPTWACSRRWSTACCSSCAPA